MTIPQVEHVDTFRIYFGLKFKMSVFRVKLGASEDGLLSSALFFPKKVLCQSNCSFNIG